MAQKNFLHCPHQNVQDFTEVCLDCGYNIYTTREQYFASLKNENVNREEVKLAPSFDSPDTRFPEGAEL